MKKILILLSLIITISTIFLSIHNSAQAQTSNPGKVSGGSERVSPDETTIDGRKIYVTSFNATDGNGVRSKYFVSYRLDDGQVDGTIKSYLVSVRREIDGKPTGSPWLPDKSIIRGSDEEKEFLKDKIPGYSDGVDSIGIASSQAVANGRTFADREAQDKANKDFDARAAGGQIKCLETNWAGFPVPVSWSGCAAMIINQVVLRIAAMFLWVAGWFFNFTLSYSLNMGNFLQTVPIVDIGWKVFRDVANLCFIFILLYIAINTILQSSAANTKKLLGTVIIVAVLLNFSLFFTKVVIDSSNILALQFYEKMGGEQTPSISSFINKNMKSGGDKGIAQTFMKGLGLSGIYNAGKSQKGADKEFQAGAWTTVGNVLAVSIGGALLITVTAFVFFAAAFMFLIRTVVLIFVMILAPLAFLSLALPKGAVIWSKWSGMLISQSFFAPLYMMLIYLVVAIIKGEFGSGVDNINDGGTMNIATFLTGNGSAVGTLYVFVVLIALMLGSLYIASSMGAVGGGFARNMAGKLTFGAGAFMSRQTIGRGAKAMQESGWVKNMAGSKKFGVGFVGRQLEKKLKSTSESSFDARSSAVGAATAGYFGGLGDAGGKGGFAQSFKDAQKNMEDQKKRVEAKTQSEENLLFDAEEQKKSSEALRAGALLRERDSAENSRNTARSEISVLEREIENERNRVAQLHADLLVQEDRATNPAVSPADQAIALAEVRRINDDINDAEGHLLGLNTQLTDTNAGFVRFGNTLEEAEKNLHKIDENYRVGVDRDDNDLAIKKIEEGVVKNRGWANEIGLDPDTASSATFLQYSNAIQQSAINPIHETANQRGKNYSQLSVIDDWMARRGITTARMSMVRGAREENRKGSDKKMLDQIKKYAEEQGVAPTPTPPPPPPTTP